MLPKPAHRSSFSRAFNARHLVWGDTASNVYEKLVFDFCSREGFAVSPLNEHTFDKSHVHGGIITTLSLCDSSVFNLLPDAFVNKVVELFNGEPSISIGHWPICYELYITKPLKHSEVRHDFTRVNCGYLSSFLELDVNENFNVLIRQILH